MRARVHWIACLIFLASSMFAQTKRVWVLRSTGEMVEYDPATFTPKQTVKVPPEAVQSPGGLFVNHLGQILFVPAVALPLTEDDVKSAHKLWFWDGHSATLLDQGVVRSVATTGSNLAITETAPIVRLAADGAHLFWFANQARRLQRDGLDLSTTNTWQAWRTDLNGGSRDDLATVKLAECRCATGVCEETCAYCGVWVPDAGVGQFFLMTQFVTGQTETTFQKSTRYQDEGGKWTATALEKPLERELDASADGNVMVDAIPDSGCCGWVNESVDQTLVRSGGNARVVFDERVSYHNPNYDVSFYTSNALLSPDSGLIAMTVVSTATANKPIQLVDEGQASPEELQRIRKALPELPAIEVKTLDDTPKRVAYVPHTSLIGWLSEKELLIIDDHLVTTYNLATGARRKSTIKVDDPARVFLR